ncbi:MAG: hypothetical protein IPJ98_19485 [Bryobacterales bacterium]|nr:hypothetical protein [Bryobacterales bacterium]
MPPAGPLALAVIFILAGAFDPTQVYGINVWAKPIKFALSIALYVWTIALMLGPPRHLAPTPWLARGIALTMFAEIISIGLQSARGVPPTSTTPPLRRLHLRPHGPQILLNSSSSSASSSATSGATSPSTPPRLRHPHRPRPLHDRQALIGVIMVVLQGHTIGAGDGGPGLPFLNWSTLHGDLRIAHAVGLHALQIIPLAAWWISTRMSASTRTAQALTLAALSVTYLGALILTLRQAFAGKPLIRM